MDQQAQNKFEAEIANIVRPIVGTEDVKVYCGTHYHMDGSGYTGYYTGSNILEVTLSIPANIVPPPFLIENVKNASIVRYEVSKGLNRCLISYELMDMEDFIADLEEISRTVYDSKFTNDMETAICSC